MSAAGAMRAFSNRREDYFSHGMGQFPLPARLFWHIAAWVVGLVAGLLWPTRFDGDLDGFMEGARHRGTVVVMNHVSMIEPVSLIVLMWRHGLHCRPIYKREFDSNAVSRWVFSRVGGIPVDRGTADLKALRNAQKALQRGECILIFPEGTRVKTDDQPVKVHGGFSVIASMAKAPVTPMAVIGARKTAPDGSKLGVRRPVYIRVGKPLELSQIPGEGRRERIGAMERRAMDEVYSLRTSLRADHPGMW